MELLSPAGDIEIFKMVIDAGADAVYFGGDMFGARAYAKNFTAEEGAAAIRYAHLHEKKAYLTVNTLLKNLEIEKSLFSYVKHYYEAGIDAVIVQDIGVLFFIRHYFPDLSIHASTQMTITGAYGADWIRNMGADRVVTAREISLSEIREIYDRTHMEIETFVHGALCMGYSGQCLMSSMLGGRSGNRGRCAQPCRLSYELFDESGKKLRMPGEYLLSPKDLCGIDDIKALSDAGVYSFKIEGRMRQKSYAAGVVSIYRKYMDACLEGRDCTVSKQDHQMLFDLGNRCGFTNAYYYKQNSKGMITYKKPSHEKKDLQIAVAEKKILLQGEFCAELGEPMKLTVKSDDNRVVTVIGNVVESAINKPTTVETIKEKLSKTGNTPFCFASITVSMGDAVFLPVGQINELRRAALVKLQEQRETSGGRNYTEKEPLTTLPGKTKCSSQKTWMVCCSTKEQFDVICLQSQVGVIVVSAENMLSDENDYITAARKVNKALYVSLPMICKSRTLHTLLEHRRIFEGNTIDGVLVGTMDGLGFLESISYPKNRIHLDYRFYTFSNMGIDAMRRVGYEHFCAPLELNQKELSHRDNADSQMLLYGRIPLMITANCQNQNCHGCNHRPSILYLQDRYKERFPVKNVCAFCYNEIYNSKIYNIISEYNTLQQLEFDGYRIDFSLENAEETKQILEQMEDFSSGTNNDKKIAASNDIFTKGHFKRGVK